MSSAGKVLKSIGQINYFLYFYIVRWSLMCHYYMLYLVFRYYWTTSKLCRHFKSKSVMSGTNLFLHMLWWHTKVELISKLAPTKFSICPTFSSKNQFVLPCIWLAKKYIFLHIVCTYLEYFFWYQTQRRQESKDALDALI